MKFLALTPEQIADYKQQIDLWFRHASTSDLDQLDAALQQFETHECRTLVSFLRECLVDKQRAKAVPASLLEQLKARGLPLGVAA